MSVKKKPITKHRVTLNLDAGLLENIRTTLACLPPVKGKPRTMYSFINDACSRELARLQAHELPDVVQALLKALGVEVRP